MQTITIAQKTPATFEATLTIAGAAFDITVCDPFGQDGRERELEWYFEEWIRFPFSDMTIAARAAASVKAYGTALFEQVFGDRRAFAAYERVAGNLSDLEIVIEGDPGFQGLHWEAMWDGDRSRPLAIDAVMVRQRRVRNGFVKVERQDSTVLNLLVVTARPDEEKDVGYRTISRPLVEAIETAKLPVNVEFVRPGTYEAFVKQLELRGAGFYHMVHFDMHGGLMTFGQFEGYQRSLGDYTFQRGYDLPSLAAYEGVQAFLFFEGDEAGMAVPVTAQEMSDRLKSFGISACVLNACQSGKQVGGGPLTPNSGGTGVGEALDVRETSLGARLMDAGMQMVVAMAYSVTVDAARLLVGRLYGELFGNVGLDRAVQKSRSELYAQKVRSVYYRQKVDLEDWLLPVVYRNRSVDLKLRRMYPEEKRAFRNQQSKRFQFLRHFPTTYGFVGRDLEILKLEKGLIRDGNILMLYGMGGTGKTTLIRYLQDWWVQTGFVEGVSYFGYDEKAWTLQQILFNVAKAVLSDEDLREFQSMSIEEQAEELSHQLRTRRWLVVLDNLESVTGQALAIQHTLNAEEQAAIRDFLMQIQRGKSRVLLGSRRREEWLASVYQGNEYELRGLDEQARSQLADEVLKKHVKDAGKRKAILADKEFTRLMKLLAGYPLAIEVVLANLGRQSVVQVLAGLDAADVSLDRAGSKTESILQCVEYSHGNLSAVAQRSLLCLAPFSGFVNRSFLPQYVKQLQAMGDAFGDLTIDALDSAVQEAIDWGLLTPMDAANANLLTIQPVFPYFLKTKLVEQEDGLRSALQLGFKNHYEGLAGYYKQLMQSKEPQEKQLGQVFCRWEYENLYAALQIALERQESASIYFCLFEFLKQNSNIPEALQLSNNVSTSIKQYSEKARLLFVTQLGLISERLAYCHLDSKQYQDARIVYKDLLDIYETIDADLSQKRLYQATVYHQLGRVAEELREYDQARQDYQQALQIYIEFGDRYEQAGTYHHLGIVAQELREYDQARQDYQQALQIYIEFGDRYEQAGTYHHLGIVAQELREYDQARQDYQQALQIYIEFGDRYSQARTYHQLGMVAQELREYDQARQDYQQALQIYIEFGDRYSQASTYSQLGLLAEALDETEEAIANHLQDLTISMEYQDQRRLAFVLGNLKRIYQSHPSPQFLAQIADRLGCSEAEVLEMVGEKEAPQPPSLGEPSRRPKLGNGLVGVLRSWMGR
jgi:tetratricopeptide (TPR) repeat protein/type II secretory pathway predicted ATPase ExeA